jgi:hypothetical protein
MSITTVFRQCVDAIRRDVLIKRANLKDKEFHFQNWFKKRLDETGFDYEQGGRNSYPDFRIVKFTEGYELKGLAYPGRDVTFDSNSQTPTGAHNGRSIYYVFGRYPKKPDGNSYPVLDLVVCHGDFLNADHQYKHKNRNVKGFGTYGDLMIRDRKMYVVPTPFHLVDGTAHKRTLILPEKFIVGKGFIEVGQLKRIEAPELIVGYSFDLQTNVIVPQKIPNPSNGREHTFKAWRVAGDSRDRVSMRLIDATALELDTDENDSEEE